MYITANIFGIYCGLHLSNSGHLSMALVHLAKYAVTNETRVSINCPHRFVVFKMKRVVI